MIGVYILSGTITPVKLINMSPKLHVSYVCEESILNLFS